MIGFGGGRATGSVSACVIAYAWCCRGCLRDRVNERPPELTETQWAAYLAQGNPAFAPGAYAFDKLYYAEEGRYPEESPLFGTAPRGARPGDHLRESIRALIEGGATEGERDAARLAFERRYGEDPDEADYLDALAHGAA